MNNKKMNILMIGYDALSRNQFRRAFKLTSNHLLNETNNYINFDRYTVVGLNTYPNLGPLLTGILFEDLNEQNMTSELKFYYDIDTSYHDLYPFIWREYEKIGYVTMFQEDAADIQVFNFLKEGFRFQPTAYYTKQFYDKM
jgi:hypothetical protein